MSKGFLALLLVLILCHAVCSSRMAREANQGDDEDKGPIRGRQTWARPKADGMPSSSSRPSSPPPGSTAPPHSDLTGNSATPFHTDTQAALFTVQLTVPSTDTPLSDSPGHDARGVFLAACSCLLLSMYALQRLWQDPPPSREESEQEVVCPHCGGAWDTRQKQGPTKVLEPEILDLEEDGQPPQEEEEEEREQGMILASNAPQRSPNGQIVVASTGSATFEEEEEDLNLSAEYDNMIRTYETQLEDPELTNGQIIILREKILLCKEKKAKNKHQKRHTQYMDQITEHNETKLRDRQDTRFALFLDAYQHRYSHAAQLFLFITWIAIKLRRLAPTTTTTLRDSLPWWIPRSLIPNVSHLLCGGILLILVLLIATIVLAQGNKWAFVCVVTLMGLVALWSMTTLNLALLAYTGLRLAIGSALVVLLDALLFWLVQRAGWVTKDRNLLTTLSLHGAGALLVLLAVGLGFELSTTEYPNFRFYSLEATLLNIVDKIIQAIDQR